MALLKEDGTYVRVEDIRVGKNLMSFTVREYSDLSLPAILEYTVNTAYDISGENPYKQAYSMLMNADYVGCTGDETKPTRAKKKGSN